MNYFCASHVPILWWFAITFTLLISLVGHTWYPWKLCWVPSFNHSPRCIPYTGHTR